MLGYSRNEGKRTRVEIDDQKDFARTFQNVQRAFITLLKMVESLS